jgi:hypothetical protein
MSVVASVSALRSRLLGEGAEGANKAKAAAATTSEAVFQAMPKRRKHLSAPRRTP